MTSAPPIVEVALLLLAVFVIGCFIGLGLRRLVVARRAAAGSKMLRQRPLQVTRPAPVTTAQSVPTEPEALVVAAAAPARSGDRAESAAPRRSRRRDDLKQIKGIGPKIESTLYELGVIRFDQIAGWDQSAIEAIDRLLAFKGRIERENWVAQATDLAAAQDSGKPPRR